jgi:hypothetical protein
VTNHMKSTFYWASIAGSDPEPVEVCTVDGRSACYTLGCGDAFFLDEKATPVRLGTSVLSPGDSSLKYLDFKTPEPMVRPMIADKVEAARIAAHYHPPKRKQHSWRGPR